MKKLLIIIPIVLLILTIPATIFFLQKRQEIRSRAAPATELSLTTSTDSPQINDTFTVNVYIKTNSNAVASADLYINYDNTKIDATAISVGPFFPNGKEAGTKSISGGKILYGIQSSTDAGAKSGEGVLAAITFKALSAGDVTINFDRTRTLVYGLAPDNNDVLENVSTLTIHVADSATPTPTATLTPPAEPTSTPTPTGSGASSSYLTSTPSPTTGIQLTSVGSCNTANIALALTIPTQGQTVSNKQPELKGTAKPLSTVSIQIVSTESTSGLATADSCGLWNYTPMLPLVDGVQNINLSESLSGVTRTASASFSILSSSTSVTGFSEITIVSMLAAIAMIVFGVIFGIRI
jgi:hypothetical protein